MSNTVVVHAHPLGPHALNENRIQLTNCEPVK